MVDERKIRMVMVIAAVLLAAIAHVTGIDTTEARFRCMGCP